MSFRKNAPTRVVWVICLVLYLVALLGHFRVFHLSREVTSWTWIIGYGLLLIATTARRL